ncbi:hypothetical protein B4100_0947 [Heyndrickxia coagulans]|nr:hypothetical protein B4100_0947 [Heyndrickxia coagulans]
MELLDFHRLISEQDETVQCGFDAHAVKDSVRAEESKSAVVAVHFEIDGF